MTDASMNVFAYGTLTFAQVMEVVAGKLFEYESGLLAGYVRYGLRGESYPALVPNSSSATEGVLWRDVDAESMSRLDAFEGAWYARTTVQVLMGDPPDPASAVDAVTYVLIPSQHHRLNRRRWSRDRFETRHLPQFMRRHRALTPLPMVQEDPRE